VHTVDGGRTWRPVKKGLVEPAFPTRDTGFAFRLRVPGEIGALTRTQNAGATWKRIGGPCDRSTQAYGSFDTAAHGRLLCVGILGAGNALKGVYETKDGGRSWGFLAGSDARDKHRSGGLSAAGYPGDLEFYGNWGLITQHRGLSYVSSDGGWSWRALRVTSPETAEGDDSSLVSPSVGFLLRSRGPQERELLRTDDGGRSWRVVRRWPRR
jgi:photosystem II stability/assembly factor-like uncharacterized protein